MDLTVKDALNIEPLNRGQLIAGEEGLDTVIRTVSVQEVNPLDESVSDTTAFIPSGNLMISSLYSVHSDVKKQIKVIQLMKRRKTAALILCHVGLILPDVSPEVLEICNHLQFPLILMPPNVGYNEIILSVSDILLDRKNAEFRYILDIYNTFISLILNEKGIGVVISTLSRMTSSAFLYYNHAGKMEHAACQDTALQKYITDFVSEHWLALSQSRDTRSIPSADNRYVIYFMPVYNNFTYFGILVAACVTELSKLDEIAITQAKKAICITGNNKVRYDTQRRHFVEDLMNNLIHADRPADELFASCNALGISLQQARAFFVMDIWTDPGEHQPHLEYKDRDALCNTVQSILSVISQESLCSMINGCICVLLIEPDESIWTTQHILSLSEQLLSQVNYGGSINVCAGLGAVINSVEELPASYLSAYYAMLMSQRTQLKPVLMNYTDFPVCILLLQMASNWTQLNDLKKSLRDLLRPLSEYDEQKKASLIETFRTLLNYNLDTSQVAEAMFLHKNTVLQRKKKIAMLCNCDPFSGMNRLQYEIAFFLKDALPL